MTAILRGSGISEIPSLDLTTPLAVVDGGTGVSTVKPYRMVLGTAIATTSGTSHDITGIPAWVKRITVMLNGVSTNGTSIPQIQLGDSGGVETTSYSTVIEYNGAPSYPTTGFYSSQGVGASSQTICVMMLTYMGSNIWLSTAISTQDATAGGSYKLIGSKTLSGTLDRIRLTTVNGTDVFDGGSFNAVYEGYED